MIKFKKRDGNITIGRQRILNTIDELPDGEYGLTIEEYKEKRRLRQNNLYWKWVQILADYHGYDKNSMHEVFLDMFAPIKTVKGLDGKPIQKKIRSSEMNVQQMSRYMECIDRHAAEFGVQLPRPENDISLETTGRRP